MKKSLPVIASLLVATCALGLSGCTDAAKEMAQRSGSTASASVPTVDLSGVTKQDDIASLLPASVSGDGTLTIATSADYSPAEFLDANGKPIGYEVDLATALSKVLGLKVKFVNAEFDSIIPAVGSKYDMSISSFTVTSERTKSVNMVAYIKVGSRFNVAKGNPSKVDPSNPLNLCGLTIGVQTGTSQEEAINTYSTNCTKASKKAINVKSYAKFGDATTALAGKALDATFADSPVADYAAKQTNGAVVAVGDLIDPATQAVVINKNDTATTQAVQKAMQYLIDKGVWNQILTAWGIDTSQALKTATINPAE